MAWFRFFSAAESVAATLRLGSGCKVVDLPFPHSYTDLPGGAILSSSSHLRVCSGSMDWSLAEATIVYAILLPICCKGC